MNVRSYRWTAPGEVLFPAKEIEGPRPPSWALRGHPLAFFQFREAWCLLRTGGRRKADEGVVALIRQIAVGVAPEKTLRLLGGEGDSGIWAYRFPGLAENVRLPIRRSGWLLLQGRVVPWVKVDLGSSGARDETWGVFLASPRFGEFVEGRRRSREAALQGWARDLERFIEWGGPYGRNRYPDLVAPLFGHNVINTIPGSWCHPCPVMPELGRLRRGEE